MISLDYFRLDEHRTRHIEEVKWPEFYTEKDASTTGMKTIAALRSGPLRTYMRNAVPAGP
jgi:hypothetical protein